MKITFVIASLKLGGAERVFTMLAREWADRGHEVSIVLFSSPNDEAFFPAPGRVHVESLGLLGEADKGVWSYFRLAVKRVGALRERFRRLSPDVVVSALPAANFAAALACFSLKIPLYLTEHSSQLDITKRPHKWLVELVYRLSPRIVVLSDEIRSRLPSSLRRRAIVIPNPVPLGVADRTGRTHDVHKGTVVSTGRLEPCKGFDDLIAAFARIAAKHPGWNVVIYGEGVERAKLEAEIARHGLAGRVSLPGAIKDVQARLAESDLFVSSSREEAWSVSTQEALSVGLPVVVTNTGQSRRIQIEGGEAGILVAVGDVDAMARAMDQLIASPELRRRLGRKGQDAAHDYSLPKVTAKWSRHFEDDPQIRKAI